MSKLITLVSRGCYFLAGVVLVFITLSVCLEVILRYFFQHPTVWVMELTEYGLLYLTFLGSAWVLRQDGHVKLDLIYLRMPPKIQTFFSSLSDLICLAVSLVLLIHGLKVTYSHWVKGIYNRTILETPKAAILIVIPVGALLMALEIGRRFYLKRSRPAPSGEVI